MTIHAYLWEPLGLDEGGGEALPLSHFFFSALGASIGQLGPENICEMALVPQPLAKFQSFILMGMGFGKEKQNPSTHEHPFSVINRNAVT